jgi:hypothetical protein
MERMRNNTEGNIIHSRIVSIYIEQLCNNIDINLELVKLVKLNYNKINKIDILLFILKQ